MQSKSAMIMQQIKDVVTVIKDAGIVLIILAVMIKARSDPKHVIAYGVFLCLLVFL